MTDLVILSGGLDSTVTLALVAESHPGRQVKAIAFDYGQRHSTELRAARAVSDYYGVALEVRDLRGALSSRSLLASSPEDVPRAAYDADNMASTVVQGRNLLFASLAVAACAPGDRVWLGVHGGDHALYPDCRPEFWRALSRVTLGAYGVGLETPFLTSSKAEIAARGHLLGAPMGLTYSCYVGGVKHCGECGTCEERREAFREARVDDPTEYLS